MYTCWAGLQWARQERGASMGCLCQYEGVDIRDHATFHGHHRFFQHQYQCLGGKVSEQSSHVKPVLTCTPMIPGDGFICQSARLFLNGQVALVDVHDSDLTVN